VSAVPLALAPLTGRIRLADRGRKQRIVAERVVIVEVLVAKAEAEDSLPNEFLDAVLHPSTIPLIGEARRESTHDTRQAVCFSEQQCAAVRGHRPTVERRLDAASPDPLELQDTSGTLCLHRASPRS
jgi:hypothetical protein